MAAHICDFQGQITGQGVLDIQSPTPHVGSPELSVHAENAAGRREAIERSSGEYGSLHSADGGIPVETRASKVDGPDGDRSARRSSGTIDNGAGRNGAKTHGVVEGDELLP